MNAHSSYFPPCSHSAMPLIVGSRFLSTDTRLPHALAGWVILACSLAASSVNGKEPELKAVFPAACQLGASVEITLAGSGLAPGASLYFSRAGLSAEHIEKDRFRVTAAADAAVGDCDLWVATPEGLAGPRRFSVTPHPVIAEREANDADEQSQQVTAPVAIDGRLDKTADLDWFAFEAEAGQLIAIHCRSASVDGSARPVFTLFGPHGRELAHSPSHEHEPRVTHRLPAKGTYRVLVHDRAYRSEDSSFYRLEVTTGTPNGAPVKPDTRLLRPDDLFGAIGVAQEQERSTREEPQAIELPCRVAGQFAQRNDVDWFRFGAKKEEVVHVEVFGERLGQLMDAEVVIFNSAGNQLAAASDLAAPQGIPAALPLASLDPATDWKVPADGEYTLAVRDLYGGSVFGSDRGYELIVAVQHPAFFAVAMPAGDKPSRGLFLKQGGSAELSLMVVRGGGFDGRVTVRAAEPAGGLNVEPCVFEEKETTKSIKVSAAEDAPPGFQSLQLVAETQIGSDKQTAPVACASQIRAGATRRIEELVIYVGE